jgi:RNA polymerase sigma-70 factor (ECF subfamily)
VYRTALAITRDPQVAEDILQDCFMRLHRYADHIDTSLPLKPWLYRVTVNLTHSWYKKRSRWQTPLENVIQKLVTPSHTSPEHQAEVSDEQSIVLDAVSSLNFNQQAAIILFYLNSLNLEEISNILGCPVGTVKSRLYYGRENIRRQLAETPPTATDMVYEFV